MNYGGLTYIAPRLFNGGVIQHADGTIEEVVVGMTLLMEGLLIDSTGFPGSRGTQERFIPWMHIKDVSVR